MGWRRLLVLMACLAACSAPPAIEPAKSAEPVSPAEYYEGTTMVVSEDESKAARGDAVAVLKLLNAICHSDGGDTEYLCQHPFPKVLASQAKTIVEQAPHACAAITDKLVGCAQFSLSGLPPSVPIAATLKRMTPRNKAEADIRDALVTALENPNPDWP